jgi:hypothetical protein
LHAQTQIKKAFDILYNEFSEAQYYNTRISIHKIMAASKQVKLAVRHCKGKGGTIRRNFETAVQPFLLRLFASERKFASAVKYAKQTGLNGALYYAISLDALGQSENADTQFSLSKKYDGRDGRGYEIANFVDIGSRAYARQVARDGAVANNRNMDDGAGVNGGINVLSGSAGGGWTSSDKQRATAKSPWESDKCDFDRRDISTLSPQEFIAQYVQKGKPCILFGEGLIHGRAREKWTR